MKDRACLKCDSLKSDSLHCPDCGSVLHTIMFSDDKDVIVYGSREHPQSNSNYTHLACGGVVEYHRSLKPLDNLFACKKCFLRIHTVR